MLLDMGHTHFSKKSPLHAGSLLAKNAGCTPLDALLIKMGMAGVYSAMGMKLVL